jgi:ribonuclease T2
MGGILQAAARLGAAALFCGLFALPANAADNKASTDEAGAFDFYVLALTWSPSYCAAAGKRANKQECGGAKHYGFIVHGLWPETETGHPQSCASKFPARVPHELGESLFDIMPSMALIGHEWRAHGTCTGLSQEAYFALLRRAREKVNVPAGFTPDKPQSMAPSAIETAFIKANPGLSGTGIAVTCDHGRVDDVRICLTKDLGFRSCAAVNADACPLPQASLPKAP